MSMCHVHVDMHMAMTVPVWPPLGLCLADAPLSHSRLTHVTASTTCTSRAVARTFDRARSASLSRSTRASAIATAAKPFHLRLEYRSPGLCVHARERILILLVRVFLLAAVRVGHKDAGS
eukprot:6820931-Prymnesium_polylepis.1